MGGEFLDEWDYFKGMINQIPKIKNVKCLKCGKKFRGSSNNRICSRCKRPNARKNFYVA
jgi:hypothetical protein